MLGPRKRSCTATKDRRLSPAAPLPCSTRPVLLLAPSRSHAGGRRRQATRWPQTPP